MSQFTSVNERLHSLVPKCISLHVTIKPLLDSAKSWHSSATPSGNQTVQLPMFGQSSLFFLQCSRYYKGKRVCSSSCQKCQKQFSDQHHFSSHYFSRAPLKAELAQAVHRYILHFCIRAGAQKDTKFQTADPASYI